MKLLYIRFALLICIQIGSVFFVATANAQSTSELGLSLGGINYKGEIAPVYHFGNNVMERTGAGARAIFNDQNLTFSLEGNVFPLSTTRQASLKLIFEEFNKLQTLSD